MFCACQWLADHWEPLTDHWGFEVRDGVGWARAGWGGDGEASNLINEYGHAEGSVYEALHVISGFHGILMQVSTFLTTSLSLAVLLIASTHPSWPTLAAALMMRWHLHNACSPERRMPKQ